MKLRSSVDKLRLLSLASFIILLMLDAVSFALSTVRLSILALYSACSSARFLASGSSIFSALFLRRSASFPIAFWIESTIALFDLTTSSAEPLTPSA